LRCRRVVGVSPSNSVDYTQLQPTVHRVNKLWVGGRHDMPPPRPATEARSGSLEAEPGPISQYASSSRPAAHAARRPDVRDRRQTDRHKTTASLNAPLGGGIKTRSCNELTSGLHCRSYGRLCIQFKVVVSWKVLIAEMPCCFVRNCSSGIERLKPGNVHMWFSSRSGYRLFITPSSALSQAAR